MQDEALEPIAIIGMGCRFPGAGDPRQFWELLRAGKQAIDEVPADRWKAEKLCDPDPRTAGKIRSWKGGFLDQVDGFDWRAWKMLPREVRHMDPQHRLLLEVAWEAFEDAGLPLCEVEGTRTSLVVGSQWNDYFRLLSRDWSRLDGYAATGNPLMFTANRISYAFGLRGPSLALDCGCASGLAVLQTACQHLWLKEAELAVAGAVELMLSPDSSIAMSATGMLSKAGRCRTLDQDADGFVRSEGAGLVVLKPLAKLEKGDRLYAVVRGIALNHNGHNEWIMASSAAAQQEVIEEACLKAAIDPAEIDYVELHGTGNPKGDPIEVQALARSLRSSRKRQRPCFIGSVKTNLGHLGPASGMASLIKVALALHHRELPPMLGPEVVHAGIALDDLGLAVADRLRPWPQKQGLPIAGVTALSLGGVNAHALLEAAPRPASSRAGAAERDLLLPLSARSPEALAAMQQEYSIFLHAAEDNLAASDVCFTTGVRRTHHEYRRAVVGRSCRELAEALDVRQVDNEASVPELPRLLWVFGDGAVGPASAWNELFDLEPACGNLLQRCARAGASLANDEVADPAAVARVRQFALAALWRSWGLRPDAIVTTAGGCGAAAWVAGALDLEEGIQFVLASTDPDVEPGSAMQRALARAEIPVYVQAMSQDVVTPDPQPARWLESGPWIALEIGALSGLWERVCKGLPSGIRIPLLATSSSSAPQRRDLLALLARLYEWGFELDWSGVCADSGQVTSLPTYPWQRQRLWPDWLDIERVSTPPEEALRGAVSPLPAPQPERERGPGDQIREAPAPERGLLVLNYVRQQAVQVLHSSAAEAPPDDRPLTDLGLDSLSANELKARVEFDLEIFLPVAELFQGATIERVAAYVREQIELDASLDALTAGKDGPDTGNDEGVQVLRL